MENILKVYIYKEGEKPVFHQARTRGIYASEGWFMKLMEGNRKFVVRDPRKAHLFYLPFSAQMLRNTLLGQKSQNHRDLQNYLNNYVKLISRKYRFWNRTDGADHFLVACHDWVSYPCIILYESYKLCYSFCFQVQTSWSIVSEGLQLLKLEVAQGLKVMRLVDLFGQSLFSQGHKHQVLIIYVHVLSNHVKTEFIILKVLLNNRRS